MRISGAILLVCGLAGAKCEGEALLRGAAGETVSFPELPPEVEELYAQLSGEGGLTSAEVSGEGDKTIYLTPEGVRGSMASRGLELLPLCAYLSPILPITPLVCPSVQLMVDILKARAPDYSALTTERYADNPDLSLPQPLVDLRGKLPNIIDKSVVSQEKRTYYWLLRWIINLYIYVFEYADEFQGRDIQEADIPKDKRPLVPPGWNNSHIFFVQDHGFKWPLAHAMNKGSHVLFVIRGTIFPSGWENNFKYNYGPTTHLEKLGIPGRVHAGFLNYTIQYLEEFRDFMDGSGARQRFEQGVTEVTFTGHSLGGVISILSSAALAARYPNLKINCVAFASPIAGDAAFSEWVSSRVNIRRVSYLGTNLGTAPGFNRLDQGVGDLVAQMPPGCPGSAPLPYCENLKFQDNPTGATSFPYEQERGNVPFYITDLPNQARWAEVDAWGLPSLDKVISNLMAKHICAYMCWLTEGTGDPEDRCYFPGDPGEHPFRCTVKNLPTINERFPFLKGTGVSSPNNRRLREQA